MCETDHPPKKTKTEATEEEERYTYITTDLHEEILLHLPSSDLLNLKRVCKDWLRLISSPKFIQKHLHRSLHINETRILMPSPSAIIDYNYTYNDPINNISKKIHYPPGFSGKNTRILGSCDGLICLISQRNHKFAVYNPSTGKSDFGPIFCSWFGHHPSTGEYVLVVGRLLLQQPNYGCEIRVYTFSSNSKFKTLHSCSTSNPQGYYLSLGETGILLHGVLHWTAFWVHSNADHRLLYIVSAYDLERNKIREISPPRQPCFELGVVDGSLFAILKHQGMFELWMMREYGVEKSWTKYRNIEGYENCRVSYPLGICRDGDLILDVDGSKLTKSNINDKEASLLKDYESNGVRSGAIVCADSLVSPAIWRG